jgi:hypothetical protein
MLVEQQNARLSLERRAFYEVLVRAPLKEKFLLYEYDWEKLLLNFPLL